MSELEQIVSFVLKNEDIEFEQDNEKTQVIPGSKKRFDFLIQPNILIEIQGGQWIKGRHNSGASRTDEYKKNNSAVKAGYIILYYGTEMVEKNPWQIVLDVRALQANNKPGAQHATTHSSQTATK